MKLFRLIPLLALAAYLCGCSSECSESDAYNKMLAINKLQGRIVSTNSEAGNQVSSYITGESGAISELIAQKKFTEACARADEFAKGFNVNLNDEMKGMITYDQLVKDGGKNGGSCSIADASMKQMEIHGKLQAKVDAGEMDSEIFRQFNQDTVWMAELLSTNPSEACRRLEELRSKYKLPPA